MSMYRNRSQPDEVPSRRRECRILRRKASGRIYSTTSMLPASSTNQGEKRLQDDGIASLVAGHHEAVEDIRRPANYLNIPCPKRPNTWRICIPFHLNIWSHKLRRPEDSTCNSLSYNPYYGSEVIKYKLRRPATIRYVRTFIHSLQLYCTPISLFSHWVRILAYPLVSVRSTVVSN